MTIEKYGEVPEWIIGAASKAAGCNSPVGSNPTLASKKSGWPDWSASPMSRRGDHMVDRRVNPDFLLIKTQKAKSGLETDMRADMAYSGQ